MSVTAHVRWNIVIACAWACAVFVSLVVFFGHAAWALDLPTFGWPYILAATAVVTLAALLSRRTAVILPSVLALCMAASQFFGIPTAAAAKACALRVVTANLFVENDWGPPAFTQFLKRERPDILVVQETRPEWEAAIRDTGLFAFESSRDLRSRDDMKVFSRPPIMSERVLGVHRPGSWDRYPVRYELQDGAGPIILYAMHPDTPRSPWQWRARNGYLGTAAHSIASDAATGRVIAVGDWNTPIYSSFFREFLKFSRLASAGDGSLWDVTRFTMKLAPYVHFGSTIDHVAISSDYGVVDRRLGPDFGSNHSPVVFDLGDVVGSGQGGVATDSRCGRSASR